MAAITGTKQIILTIGWLLDECNLLETEPVVFMHIWKGKTAMRFLIGFFVLLSITNGQDTLFTTSGIAYIGKFIEKTDKHVLFHEVGATNAQPVPLRVVARMGMYQGEPDGNFMPEVNRVDDKTSSDQDGRITRSAFGRGTISAGSLFSYSSAKSSADDNDPTNVSTIGAGLNDFSVTIKPSFSYFIFNNVSLDGILSLTRIGTKENSTNYNIYGLGSSYYANNFYLGIGYAILASGSGDSNDRYNSSYDFVEVHSGYLYQVSSNVFFDLGLSYMQGLKSKHGWNGQTETEDNEETILRLDFGVKAFFNPF